MHVSLEIVKAVIKDELNLGDVPVGETFFNLGFQEWQLQRIRQRFARGFNKSVMPMLSDTVYTYTDKLLADKYLTPSAERTIAAAKQDPLI